MIETLSAFPSTDRRTLDSMSCRERQELEQANALAQRLAALKELMMDTGAVHQQKLRQLQKRHSVHLRRCLRLRSRLDTGAETGDASWDRTLAF